MKCISCGCEIPDSKRMCDKCAVEMVSRIIDGKKKQEESKIVHLPKGAGKFVRRWVPGSTENAEKSPGDPGSKVELTTGHNAEK